MRFHGDVNQPTSPADVLEMPHVCMFAALPPNKVAAKATQEQLGPRTKHMIGQNKKVSSTVCSGQLGEGESYYLPRTPHRILFDMVHLTCWSHWYTLHASRYRNLSELRGVCPHIHMLCGIYIALKASPILHHPCLHMHTVQTLPEIFGAFSIAHTCIES